MGDLEGHRTRVSKRFDLLALDVDGTLVGSDPGIARRVLQVLRRVRERRMRICLCTARALAATQRYLGARPKSIL